MRQIVTTVVEAHCEIATVSENLEVHVGNIQNCAGPQDLWVKNPSCAQFLIVWGVSFMGSIALPSGPQRGVQDAQVD